MNKDAVDRAHRTLCAASALLAIEDADELAMRVASLLRDLERDLSALLQPRATSADSEEREQNSLYVRAVDDYSAMQSELSMVRDALSDKQGVLQMLREVGHEVESTRRHLMLVGAMDRALQHLVHLMQYDSRDRALIDIRNGFQLSSGSTNYGRFYFEPPKEKSGA